MSTRVHPPVDRAHDAMSATSRRRRGARGRAVAALVELVALVALLAACGREGAATDARERGVAARAAGLWDAEFRMTRTPRGAEPDGAKVARGTMALMATRRDVGREWLQRATTHTGVIDVDFRPLGFVPEGPGPVPTLVAAVADPDTLLAVTPAGTGDGTLALRGAVSPDGDSVVGTWTYATRAVGGWGGTFTLHRPSVGGL